MVYCCEFASLSRLYRLKSSNASFAMVTDMTNASGPMYVIM